MDYREKRIITTSWIGITGNLILSLLKIIVGIIAGSMAVVGDGIDSASDVVISFMTLFTARIISKPPDKKFPYGYARADTIATLALSFLIFFAGAQLIITTISQLVRGDIAEIPSNWAIAVTAFSILGKFILSLIHIRVGKKIESKMLVANGRHMQNDILLSLGVLLGLFFILILELPVLDKIVALLVGLWIMKVGLRIFLRTNTELMDGIKDPGIYEKIFKAVSKVEGVSNPHKVRVRQISNKYIIDVDIEVDGKTSVREAHSMGVEVEEQIRNEIKNVYDVLVHVEPLGNIEEEVYGVSEEKIKK